MERNYGERERGTKSQLRKGEKGEREHLGIPSTAATASRGARRGSSWGAAAGEPRTKSAPRAQHRRRRRNPRKHWNDSPLVGVAPDGARSAG
ncbi:pollen-specific leucine-rich repeat extensin-like protein 4 [Iris pallida]|uniref:Pollen-specific leucine-rich repeat extensin-like protein 4 n=1 Tax=Iris pallida TaxID=29817 RepID=A0AAX6FAE2_IRIPA|nr:pollen-specific leucine-rich repeat extensin-like protein 4 [Iris pallida]